VRSRLAEGAHGAPRLGLRAVSKEGWKVVEQCGTPRFYFDWVAARKKMSGDSARRPTRRRSTYGGPEQAIELIREEGLQTVFARHRILGRACKEGVKALGLELFGPTTRGQLGHGRQGALGWTAAKIGKIARDKYGVWLAGGQGQAQGPESSASATAATSAPRTSSSVSRPSRWCSPSSATTSKWGARSRRRASVRQERGLL